MIIADKLRHTNRAEYILYMWQLEDLIRSYGCNFDELNEHYLRGFQLDEARMAELRRWYSDLCRMMVEEGVKSSGHLQINKNALSELEELHQRLLASDRFPYYRSMYYKALPYIVELRARQKHDTATEPSELETCFNALYGTFLLRLQHKEISPETQQAAKDISTLLGQLSDYYFKDKEEPIDFEQ